VKFKDSYLKSSTELTYTEWLENSHEKVCLENSKHYESANKNFRKLTEAKDRIKELEGSFDLFLKDIEGSKFSQLDKDNIKKQFLKRFNLLNKEK